MMTTPKPATSPPAILLATGGGNGHAEGPRVGALPTSQTATGNNSPNALYRGYVKAKVDSLFFAFLSSEQAQNLIRAKCEEVKAGRGGSVNGLLGNSTASIAASSSSGLASSSSSSSLMMNPLSLKEHLITESSPQRLIRKQYADEYSTNVATVSSLLLAAGITEPSSPPGLIDGAGGGLAGTPPGSRRSLLRKSSSRTVVTNSSAANSGSKVRRSRGDSPGGEDDISIPRFYDPVTKSPVVRRIPGDSLTSRLPTIDEIFARAPPEGLALSEEFTNSVCKTLCGWPTTFAIPLFRRIRLLTTKVWRSNSSTNASVSPSQRRLSATREGEFGLSSTDIVTPPATPRSPPSRVPTVPYNPCAEAYENLMEMDLPALDAGFITREEFLEWWRREMEPYDVPERFFRLVKRPEAEVIVAEDFFPFVRELIEEHPGLEFLESTPEFQEKYARTVVARIMYRVNTSWTGEVTRRELRASDLLHYFHVADEDEEINAINEYFSYEHFYVIYCKFWELDSDHDFLLSQEDLSRHSAHALTVGIVERIFQEPARRFTSRVPGRMGFEDFVWFLLAEEDKTSEVSLKYWFRCVDLDGDGRIRAWEVRTFYEEQERRMKGLGCEEVLLKDVIVQMRDCLEPYYAPDASPPQTSSAAAAADESWSLSLEDFTHPKKIHTSGVFFNLLFNLNKFITHEGREPCKLSEEEANMTDWDRYAELEYARLASAEEARNSSGTSAAAAVAQTASTVVDENGPIATAVEDVEGATRDGGVGNEGRAHDNDENEVAAAADDEDDDVSGRRVVHHRRTGGMNSTALSATSPSSGSGGSMRSPPSSPSSTSSSSSSSSNSSSATSASSDGLEAFSGSENSTLVGMGSPTHREDPSDSTTHARFSTLNYWTIDFPIVGLAELQSEYGKLNVPGLFI